MKTQYLNCPHMVEVTKRILADEKARLADDKSERHYLIILWDFANQMENCIRIAATEKTLKAKKAVINEYLEELGDDFGITMQGAQNYVVLAIANGIREAMTSFWCLGKATTFKEYEEQVTFCSNMLAEFNRRHRGQILLSNGTLKAGKAKVAYWRKELARWAAARTPKVAVSKADKKLAIAQHYAAWTDGSTGAYIYWQPIQTTHYPFRTWALAVSLNSMMLRRFGGSDWE